MNTVTSADGTIISFEKSGNGQPLVLLHGAGLDLNFWDLSGVRPELAKHASIYAVNRRGRHESGDASDYNMVREVEDVAALIDMIGQPVILLGHSYGALIALEAAAHIKNLRGLIIYEPFTLEASIPYLQKALDKINDFLAKGEKEQAIIFLLKAVNMPEEAIGEYRSYPSWSAMVDAADKLRREFEFLIDYKFVQDKFLSVTTPTLLLLGNMAPPPTIEATEMINQTLPNSRLAVFDGHGHWAMNSATYEFINVVLDFIHDLD